MKDNYNGYMQKYKWSVLHATCHIKYMPLPFISHATKVKYHLMQQGKTQNVKYEPKNDFRI